MKIILIEGRDKLVWCGKRERKPLNGDVIRLEEIGIGYKVLEEIVPLARDRHLRPDYVFRVEFAST